MTMPGSDGEIPAQVLIKLGEISAQLMVMQKDLDKLPDHENRIRDLEKGRWPVPTISAIAAVGAVAAAWVTVIHHG
jgi:hypothetical protein